MQLVEQMIRDDVTESALDVPPEQRAIRVLEQLARHHAVAEWCGAAGSVSERRIADGAPGRAFGGLTGGLLRASVVDGRRVPIAG